MRAAFRDRNFRLLAAGQTLSAFGDYAMFLALAVWVKDLTGSNAAAGLTVLPFVVPALFGPALGVFVDRFPRRWVMIIADLVAAAAMLSLLAVGGPDDVWQLYAVAFVYGTCVTVYQGARSGLLVAMLPEAQLGDANGFLQASNQAMRLAAPLAGAAIYSLAGGHAVATFDAATFLVSVAFLLAVRSADIERRTDAVRVWPELKEGLRHIARTDDIRRLTIGTAVVTLMMGVSEVAIFAVIDEGLHRPPAFLGVISSVQGVGAIGAGIAAGILLRRIGEMRVIAVAAMAGSLGLALFGTGVLPLVFVAAAGFGVANTLYQVGYMTVMQRRTPLEMQGRVMTAVEAVTTVPFLLSLVLGAAIISFVSFRLVYGVEAAGLLGVGVYFARGSSFDPAAPMEAEAAA